MRKITEWISQNKQLLAVILINILFLSFFFYFTSHTGLFKDDYGYMYMFTREEKLINDRVDSLGEVFSSQFEHYFIMNGRSVTHTMLQTVLMLGRGWFNVLNTLFYFALSFGMYLLIIKNGHHSPLIQIMTYLAPWALFAEFGDIFLVSYLSVNYLWAMAIIIVVLVPFKRLFDGIDMFEKIPAAGALIMLIAGIISGWLSENGSAAMLFIVGCMGLYYLIAKKKIPVWCFTGFAGMLAGFLAMLLAPGYDVRSSGYGEYSYFFQFKRISVEHIMPYYGYILAALICLACLLYFRGEKQKKQRLIFLAAAAGSAAIISLVLHFVPVFIYSDTHLAVLAVAMLLCVWQTVAAIKAKAELIDIAAPAAFMITGFVATYAMIASPTFETRSELQFLIFFTCGAAFVFYELLSELSGMLKTRLIKPVLLAAAVIYSAVSLVCTVPAVNDAYDQFLAREQYIEEQKSQENYDVYLCAYDEPDNSHVGIHNMYSSDPEYWINEGTCWYYGINSVTYEVNK